MSKPLFVGSRAKLQRAARFVDELETALNEYNQGDPVTGRIDSTKMPPELIIDYKGLPLEVGAILGDAIHNMRTALDLMASELARINGKSDKDIYFPFAASIADFPDAIKRKNFQKAGEDAVALLKKFAPYRGGNERLRAIHDIDIEDKHTAILDTEKKMNIQAQVAYDMSNPEINRVSLNGSTIQHFFANESPLKGLPVVDTLRELLGHVGEILDSFSSMVDLRSSADDDIRTRPESRNDG
ncbi:MAG: hypothetical protein OEY80_00960 [Nitrospirota bacterium]|nr:hypothetical protein [Nitrospirota bacterium]MDH4360516.1 hypothetical protein [Nitrospirota bacterium]MDH5574031.1 hypothetical protein [Nitrospirota bacterium]